MNRIGVVIWISIFVIVLNEEMVGKEQIRMEDKDLLRLIEKGQKKYIILDEEYKFTISEDSSIIINANLTENHKLSLFYNANDIFSTCFLNDQNKACFSQLISYKQSKGYLSLNNSTTHQILIINPSMKTLHITLRMHRIMNNCHYILPSNIYALELVPHLCFVFKLNQNKDSELFIESQTYMANYSFQLCGKDFQPIQKLHQNRFSILAQSYAVECLGIESKQLKIQFINEKKLEKGKQNEDGTFVEIVLEISNEPILLMDGIGYSTSISNPLSPKVFVYDLIYMNNTSINVYSSYSLDLFVKIVNKDQINKTIPSQNNQDFSSKKGLFLIYYNPFIFISEKELTSFKCEDCYLILSIFPEKAITDNIVVEISQNEIELVNAKTNHKFLPKNSIVYYKYYSKRKQDLSIQIADNNQYCTIGYLSNKESPGPMNNLAKIKNNKLVFKTKSYERYYIAIEALEICSFSITLYDSTTLATHLQKGKFGFLDLKQGQSRLFWIKSSQDEYLKILSTQTYGKVQIYLNQTTLKQIQTLKNTKNFTKFSKAGQYPNRLILTKQDSLYKSHEYYLIGVYAQKNTEATLFYGNEKTAIPIQHKTINDILLVKGDKAKGEYMSNLKANYRVQVNSGKLKLTFSNGDKANSKQFESSLLEHKDSFDFDVEQHDQIKSAMQDIFSLLFDTTSKATIKVQFQAIQNNTVYSLTISPFDEIHDHNPSALQNNPIVQEKIQYIQLNTGQSYYTLIGSGTKYIVKGFLRDKKEQIIITSDYKDKQKLGHLKLNMQIDHKPINISTTIVQNIMVISVPLLKNYYIDKAIQYQMTIVYEFKEIIWVNIMQAQDFSLLPPQVDAIVNQTYTFVVHAQNNLILDVFECKGHYKIAYASSREELSKVQNTNLDMIGLANQPHAIRINKFATTFIRVNIPLGIVRWFPFNIEAGIGTGYLDYKIDEITYENNLFGIDLRWKSLAKINKVQSKIKDINYTLYVSAHKDDLQFAAQCGELKPSKVLKIENIVKGEKKGTLDTEFIFGLQKKLLFSIIEGQQALFLTIVCDVTLQTKKDATSDKDERYRFISPSIQIPSEIITSKQFISKSTTHEIVVIIILFTISFIIISAICIKKIIPLLARLKNRTLLEQDNNVIQSTKPNELKDQGEIQGNMEVPMSSDRNNQERNNSAMETDEYLQAK